MFIAPLVYLVDGAASQSNITVRHQRPHGEREVEAVKREKAAYQHLEGRERGDHAYGHVTKMNPRRSSLPSFGRVY